MAAAEQAMLELGGNAIGIHALLNTIMLRLEKLEQCVEEHGRQTEQLILATRVRRPVRDDDGTILYVVDEIVKPRVEAMED